MNTLSGNIVLDTVDDLVFLAGSNDPVAVLDSLATARAGLASDVQTVKNGELNDRKTALSAVADTRRQLIATMQSKISEAGASIKGASVQYRQESQQIMDDVVSTRVAGARVDFQRGQQAAQSSALNDLTTLENDINDYIAGISARVDAKLNALDQKSSAGFGAIETKLDTEFAAVVAAAKADTGKTQLRGRIATTIAALVKDADAAMARTSALVDEKLSPAELAPKKQRIWSGGCSSTMHSWGWQRYCYDREEFNTMGDYGQASGTEFTVNVAGITRVMGKWWSHCYWVDIQLFVDGSRRHYGRSKAGGSRHWRSYWGDGWLDSAWPMNSGSKFRIEIHREGGSHQWHSFTNDGHSRVQFHWLGSF